MISTLPFQESEEVARPRLGPNSSIVFHFAFDEPYHSVKSILRHIINPFQANEAMLHHHIPFQKWVNELVDHSGVYIHCKFHFIFVLDSCS